MSESAIMRDPRDEIITRITSTGAVYHVRAPLTAAMRREMVCGTQARYEDELTQF